MKIKHFSGYGLVNYHDAKDIAASRLFCEAEHSALDVL